MLKINSQLQKINTTSLAKIIFYKEPFKIFMESLDFYNIVFAKNGIYIVLNNKFGTSFDLLKHVKYSNNQLDEFEFENIVMTATPKPKLEIFNEILEMFKYICNKTKWELCVNVYYDTIDRDFKLNLHDQIISSTKATYDYNENFEMSSRYIRYLQIHSHNTMEANFSGTDDHDENYSSLCFCGVIGKITSESKFYNVDMKYRIWSGTRFINFNFEHVFDIGYYQKSLSITQIQKLDNIIEKSKEASKSQKQTTINFNNLTTHNDDFFKQLTDESNLPPYGYSKYIF
jgi:hypothetical protein